MLLLFHINFLAFKESIKLLLNVFHILALIGRSLWLIVCLKCTILKTTLAILSLCFVIEIALANEQNLSKTWNRIKMFLLKELDLPLPYTNVKNVLFYDHFSDSLPHVQTILRKLYSEDLL